LSSSGKAAGLSGWRQSESSRDGDVLVATAQASGDFPGSPLPFAFRFASEDDFAHISRLTIELIR